MNRWCCLWTDGSGGRSGPIGYAWRLQGFNPHTGELKEIAGDGAEREGTVNRAELLAVHTGLLALKRPTQVVVFSDSRYVVDSVEQGRLATWAANAWRKATKSAGVDGAEWMCPLCAHHGFAPDEPCLRHSGLVLKRVAWDPFAVANQDIWMFLLEQMGEHDVRFVHVDGHTGLVLNEDCDRRAGAARKALVAELAEAAKAADVVADAA